MLKIALPDNFFYEAALKVPYAIAAVGLDGKFLWVNDAFCRLVGYADVELRSLSWVDITNQSDIGPSLLEINRVINKETDYYTLTKKIYKKNGDLIDISLLAYRYPPNGDVLMLEVYVDNLMTTDLYIKKIMVELAEIKTRNDNYTKTLNDPNMLIRLIQSAIVANWGIITIFFCVVSTIIGWGIKLYLGKE